MVAVIEDFTVIIEPAIRKILLVELLLDTLCFTTLLMRPHESNNKGSKIGDGTEKASSRSKALRKNEP